MGEEEMKSLTCSSWDGTSSGITPWASSTTGWGITGCESSTVDSYKERIVILEEKIHKQEALLDEQNYRLAKQNEKINKLLVSLIELADELLAEGV